jgi:hypothetical protein
LDLARNLDPKGSKRASLARQRVAIAVTLRPAYIWLMTLEPLNIAIFVAMAAVFIVLIAGIANLAITGDKARSRSNQLMRLRVLVQFLAVILLMIGFWFKTRAG